MRLTNAASGSVAAVAPWRLRALVVLLLLLVCAAGMRLYWARRKPAPPPTASLDARLRYYHERISRDPSDSDAYVELGRLEEANGYYMAATRRFTQARALGVSDRETVGALGRSLLRLARFDEAKLELEKAMRIAPDSVEAAVNLAGWYNLCGQPNGAIRLLHAFVDQHPTILAPTSPAQRQDLERLLLCCAEIGDRQETIKLADRLIQVAPEDPTGYAVAGKVLLELQHPREAHERLAKALTAGPDQATLRFYNGVALSMLGDHAQALNEWLRAVTLDHNLPIAYYWIGDEYARRREWKLAGVAYAQAAVLNNYDLRACRLAARMFERAGAQLDARYWEGTAAGVAGNHRQQLASFMQILSLPGPLARRIGLRGVTAAYQGLQRPDEFLQSMRKLATRDTDNDYMLLAEAYGDLDRFPMQEQYLQKALAKNPRRAGEIHYRLGLIAKQLGQRDLAEQEFQRSLQAEPENVPCHRDLADLYFERRTQADRQRRAIEEYRLVVSRNSDSSDDWQHLGVAYLADGDNNRAVQCLEHAIDLQPGNGTAYQELGRVYMQMGDRASGKTMLEIYRRYVSYTETAHTLKTRANAARKDPGAQIQLADFLLQAGDLDSAAERYALALQVRPDDPPTRYKLARIYARTGRKDLEFDLERSAPSRKAQAPK